MSAFGALFKDFKRRNYFIKKSNISIFDALITQIFMINYYLKALTNVLGYRLTFPLKYWAKVDIETQLCVSNILMPITTTFFQNFTNISLMCICWDQ